jgi:L-alanine-DL-glutamate epimerase-like enolase superfamily enzyme
MVGAPARRSPRGKGDRTVDGAGMKITRIETIPIRVPVKPQLAIRSGRGGSHSTSPFLIVKVHTDEGITGLGEVSCTPRWSGEDQFTAAHFINSYFAPLLVGEDPVSDDSGRLASRFTFPVSGNPFTKAGVEMALWDIRGKAMGKPVYDLLGGAVREAVATKWSVSGRPPAEAAAIARDAVMAGFRKMKVKVGIDPEEDVARVRAVREAVGPDVDLGVDANGGWGVEDAIATSRRLCELGIVFVEQPVAAGDPLGMARVRREIAVPVIADESVYTLPDAQLLAKLEAADVLSIYVGKAGGILPAMRIVEFAEEAGLACTIGSNLELGIGSAAMVHLALAARGVAAERFACDIIGPLFYEDDILAEPLRLESGEARATYKPGLGIELDDAKVEQYRVR